MQSGRIIAQEVEDIVDAWACRDVPYSNRAAVYYHLVLSLLLQGGRTFNARW